MRELVHSILLEGLDETSPIPAQRWYGSGAIKDTPPRPFAESRYGGRFPGMGRVVRRRLEVWIHDEPGDYGLIESQIKYVKSVLDGLEQVQAESGEQIILCTWVNDSTDLTDDGYGTICMSTTFELVGKEATT